MKIVYIAGPFRGHTAWEIEKNIRRAEELGLEVAHAGAMPLIPHTNTRFFHGLLSDAFWLAGTIEMLRRCDAIMVVENWESSKGTMTEIREAEEIGLPVFYSTAALLDWLRPPRDA